MDAVKTHEDFNTYFFSSVVKSKSDAIDAMGVSAEMKLDILSGLSTVIFFCIVFDRESQ